MIEHATPPAGSAGASLPRARLSAAAITLAVVGGLATLRAKPPTGVLAEPWAMISPWAGLGVACAYAAAGLGLAGGGCGGGTVSVLGGALTAVLTLLFASPLLALLVSDTRWQHRVHRFSPMDAGLAIQATRDLGTIHIGQWAGVGLLGAYALAAVLAGGLAFRLRDA